MLLSEINLAYYQELMAGMRAAIGEGRFAEFRAGDARDMGTRRYSGAFVKRCKALDAMHARGSTYSRMQRACRSELVDAGVHWSCLVEAPIL